MELRVQPIGQVKPRLRMPAEVMQKQGEQFKQDAFRGTDRTCQSSHL